MCVDIRRVAALCVSLLLTKCLDNQWTSVFILCLSFEQGEV